MPGVDPSSRLDSSASRVIGAEIMHATPWLQFKHLSFQEALTGQQAVHGDLVTREAMWGSDRKASSAHRSSPTPPVGSNGLHRTTARWQSST